MRSTTIPTAHALLAISWGGTIACAAASQPGRESGGIPGLSAPRLFDAETVYRGMGFFTAPDPLPFVVAVRFLGGPSADSTLAVVGVSLPAKSLSFRRAGAVFESRYRAELSFRRSDHVIRQTSSEELVRVASFQETQRSDESVVFQRFFVLPPGSVWVAVMLRDVYGAGFSHVEGMVAVPRYGSGPALAEPLPVYRGVSRRDRAEVPSIVVNPRATVPYGADSVGLYLEAYGLGEHPRVVLRAVADTELWRDTLALVSGGGVATLVTRLATARLPVGKLQLEAFLPEGADTVRAEVLVNLSERWVVSSFDEVLVLLRYFGHEGALGEMREAGSEQRTELWRAFWEATDSDPATPQHEAIDAYFRRLEEANRRFRQGDDAGWLTDRGEVFITLGEPDHIFDSSSDFEFQGTRHIRWTYVAERLTLDFVDEGGFGTFELTGASRIEYSQALDRVRSTEQ